MPAAEMTGPAESQDHSSILQGCLTHVVEGRSTPRWVVLEKNQELRHVYLNIYRKPTSTPPKLELRQRYELTPQNFVGTERGTIKVGGKRFVRYWAVILTDETILFKDKEAAEKAPSEFEKWNETVKKLWNHQSWEISPIKGDAIAEHQKLILHLNSASLCLALLSPPRRFLQWPLSCIKDCHCHDCVFSFTVEGNHKPGDYEVRVMRSRNASKIKSVCKALQQEYQDKDGSQEAGAIGDDAMAKLLKPHRNSNASSGSTSSLNREETSSLNSFDSAVSTPSPTPQRHERGSPNPFIFPLDSASGVERGNTTGALFVPDVARSPGVLPASATPLPHQQTLRARPVSNPWPNPQMGYINTHPSPGPPSDPSTADHYQHPHPPRSSPPDFQAPHNRFSHPARMGPKQEAAYDVSSIVATLPLPTTSPNEGSVLPHRHCQGSGGGSEEGGHPYGNLIGDTDNVDMSTEPDPQVTYLNVSNSHYQNPTIPKEPVKDNVGPKVPPKPTAPDLPPRKYELQNIIARARNGYCLGTALIPSNNAMKNFCLYFDVKKDSSTINDWRALAERVGFTVPEIELIEHTSNRKGTCTATEMVLSYWQSHPRDDLPFTLDQLIKELERIDRLDLIDILRKDGSK